MKKIEAFIKKHRLDEVASALHHVKGLSGMTLTDARGFGRGRGASEAHPTPEMIRGFIDIVHIGVFCPDTLADEVLATIERAAHTGLRGDGKAYLLPVEQAVRISTGERGEAAV